MKAAVSSPDADRLYLTRYSTGIYEYAIDSACAFDTMGHARALQEDALYGACSYDRQPLDQLPDSRSDSYDDIIYAAGYLSLASYVWGANAHLDLLRGQVNQTSATPLSGNWYARVWHDALFGQSTPGELYKWTARTKTTGASLGIESSPNVSLTVAVPKDTINMVLEQRCSGHEKRGVAYPVRLRHLMCECLAPLSTVYGLSSVVVRGNIALHQNEPRLQPCPSGKHALAGLRR
ncbi:hypothetical protein AtubIFM61612_005022 [Aspergillus tubingensis]|nr:hypothetical protein AtubIFM61612_005022 [Aspergillus tubingensis]